MSTSVLTNPSNLVSSNLASAKDAITSGPSKLVSTSSNRRTTKEQVSDMLERSPFMHVSEMSLVQKNTFLDAYPPLEGTNRLLRNSSTSQDVWIERALRKLSQGQDPYKK